MLSFDKFFYYPGMVIKQYKSLRMLVALCIHNNIIAHRLLIGCRRVLLDHYQYQTTNDIEKLLKQENLENTTKIAIASSLTIGMYIRPTRLLEVGLFNVEYDSVGKLYGRCTDVDWGNEGKIEEAMAATDDNKDDDKENS